jgi:hypothetical protein
VYCRGEKRGGTLEPVGVWFRHGGALQHIHEPHRAGKRHDYV